MPAAASRVATEARTLSEARAMVVVGAGRSGTSAITRGLQALGIELGDHLKPAGGKNPTGFFEDQSLLAINKRLRRILVLRADSVALIEPDQWRAPPVQALHQEAVETIRRRFGRYPLWGYKYGRTLRLLPFWEDVYRSLDLDVRYVVAVRNPLSVARSRAKLDPRRGRQEHSDLEWLVNVVPYFRRIQERPFVVVDYDLLMANPVAQMERVAGALDIPVTAGTKNAIQTYAAEFLRRSMRHSQFSDDDLGCDGRVNVLTRDAYRWLRRLATDEVGPHAAELWEDWQRIEHGVAAMAPVLRHIDQVEAELRRAQRNPLGPLQLVPALWRKLRRA
ncbi:MAG: sulfotransferase family protein [Candidatus Binatia bacterium]